VSGTIRAPGEVSNATSIRTGSIWAELSTGRNYCNRRCPPAASNAAAETANIEIARATHHACTFSRLRQPATIDRLPTCRLPNGTWKEDIFRLNLFQRHDLSHLLPRPVANSTYSIPTSQPAVISPSRSTTAQRREGLVPPFCSPHDRLLSIRTIAGKRTRPYDHSRLTSCLDLASAIQVSI